MEVDLKKVAELENKGGKTKIIKQQWNGYLSQEYLSKIHDYKSPGANTAVLLVVFLILLQ